MPEVAADEAKAIGKKLATRLGNWHGYATMYLLAELFGVAHVVAQVFLINWFLDGKFASLGIDFATYDGGWHVKDNPLVRTN